jgi:transposase
MSEVTIIGIDIAKGVFPLHGERADESVVFRKKFFRGKVLGCLAE